jgi:transcriptional regulator with XRE-family HTH domain
MSRHDRPGMTMVTIWNGQNLQQARLRVGLTQEGLARAIETSVTNISRWERGRNGPSAPNVFALARILGVEPEWFFQEDA